MTEPDNNLEPTPPREFNALPSPIVEAEIVPEQELVQFLEPDDSEVVVADIVDVGRQSNEDPKLQQADLVDSNVDFLPQESLAAPPVVNLNRTETKNESQTGPTLGHLVDSSPEPIAIDVPSVAGDVSMELAEDPVSPSSKSWVFRFAAALSRLASHLFGIISIVFLLAVAASIPVVQLLSFGYLLEVSGRLARKMKFRDAMIGLNKASKLGGIVVGTWITLLPIRFVSEMWLEAYLIDPTSTQTAGIRIAQVVLIVLAVLHIGAAWTCGGKLRYFFWPIIAPFSFGVWLFRRIAGASIFRKLLSITVGWISPHLVNDICNAQPIGDWFVPAILIKRVRAGKLYSRMRDGVWHFTMSLNLDYYFMLGLKGFVGSFAWLLFPTTLLVIASYAEGGTAMLSGIFGVVFAIPIFMMLPFLQAHFARDGKLRRFVEIRQVYRNYGRAPIAHVIALLLTLVLALPLFFLKIEEIPGELLWTLSVVFIMFSWPARTCVGWAYRRGAKRESTSRWWIRFPIVFLAAPIALAFALILTLTRYVSWHGALSLFENHVFLLPAPFWM